MQKYDAVFNLIRHFIDFAKARVLHPVEWQNPEGLTTILASCQHMLTMLCRPSISA